jgi:hypothetical protein
MQEAQRKEVERAFGVLQARFAVVAQPAQGWKHHNLNYIMKGCIILHNMILEDERDSYLEYTFNHTPAAIIRPIEMLCDEPPILFSDFICNYQSMKDSSTHFQLHPNLIKNQWEIKVCQEDTDFES